MKNLLLFILSPILFLADFSVACPGNCTEYRTTYVIVNSGINKELVIAKGKELAMKLKSKFFEEKMGSESECTSEEYCLKVFKVNETDTLFAAGFLVGNRFKKETKKARILLKKVKEIVKDSYIKFSEEACACE